MTKKRGTEITVETERVLVIRRRYRAVEEWCVGCNETVLMIRPDQAAAVAGVSLRSIFTEVEAATLHFVEKPDGMLLICLNSLSEKRAKSD